MPSNDFEQLRVQLGDRYQLERELGRGGMGAVYLAREVELDRLVALKVLPSEFAADPVLRDRFLRESRTAASFSHPNIVPVYAVEERRDVLAFAMGYVEGESLADRVKRSGPLTARDAVRLMHDVAYALAYAHGRGTVHRDIKPDNILIDRATNRALIMDFGVARRREVSADTVGLTRVGEVVGTPEYMSPEQATGDVVDGRSDLYSLGLVMWFALTGRTAMGGESAPRILVRQLTELLPPMASARGDLPNALTDAVDRCLHKEPNERFADAGELSTALDDAELVAPEVPLPIRLLARELSLLSVALPFALMLGAIFFTRQILVGFASIDALVVVVVLMAVLIARLGQAMGEVSRIARLGFDEHAVATGLRAAVDEDASAREAGRHDPDLLHDRRRSLVVAAIMLVVALLSAFAARYFGAAISGRNTNPIGVAFFFNSIASFGVCLVLAARDPRRMSVAEWLYRAFWLRAPGQGLIRRVMRAEAQRVTTAGGTTTAVLVPMIAASAEPAGGTARMIDANLRAAPRGADLETRVRALEEWRVSVSESRLPRVE